MQRTLAFFTVALGISITSFVFADQNDTIVLPTIAASVSNESDATMVSLPQPTATAWGIFDLETGGVIVGHDEDAELPIASVTKLFVANAVASSIHSNDELSVTWSDLSTEGESGKLYNGMRTTPRELLMPLLLESSNDAGEAIRRALGTQYESLIENVIRENNLTETKIVDGSGLSPYNVSSVRDLARFYHVLRDTNAYVLDITSVPMYISDEEGYVNNNPLHTHPLFVAGKHGFTLEAGKTFVGSFSLSGTQHEIGVVLLGSTNLDADVDVLLGYAEATF